MGKKLKIFLIAFAVIIALLIIFCFLIYNFFSITVMSLCISNNVESSGKSCLSNQECVDVIFENDNLNLENLPTAMSSQADLLFDKTVYCEDVCKMKKIQLVYFILDRESQNMELEKVDSCSGEQIDIKLTLKEIVEFIKMQEGMAG